MNIYIYIYFFFFFCGLAVGGTKGKKKMAQWRLERTTAHFLFVLSHDTADCIITQGA